MVGQGKPDDYIDRIALQQIGWLTGRSGWDPARTAADSLGRPDTGGAAVEALTMLAILPVS